VEEFRMKIMQMCATKAALLFGTTPGKEESVIATLHLWNGRLRMQCGFPKEYRGLAECLKQWFVAPFDADAEAFLNRVLAESGVLDLLRERFPNHEISSRIIERPA
jgi:hypothetical protein